MIHCENVVLEWLELFYCDLDLRSGEPDFDEWADKGNLLLIKSLATWIAEGVVAGGGVIMGSVCGQ